MNRIIVESCPVTKPLCQSKHGYFDENEVTQLRHNSVVREAAKIQGAAAAASRSAEAQSMALAREVNELREVIGEKPAC